MYSSRPPYPSSFDRGPKESGTGLSSRSENCWRFADPSVAFGGVSSVCITIERGKNRVCQTYEFF